MANRRFSRPRQSRFKAIYRRLGKRGRTTILLIIGALFLWGAGTVLWWSKDLPNPENIDDRRVNESTKIFDASGENLLYEIGEIHRTRVPLDRISPKIIDATIATEDDQFYDHHGLDFNGIIRGVILKPLSGQRAQGGSTITQQLIKNAILTPERTIRRKVKEAVLALELEQRFSKDQILEMYLNDIPYGSLAYGAEAAANTFFDKSAADVSLAEAAILAALPKAPTYYSPYGSRFEDLKFRQERTLDRMAELGMVTAAEADAAKAEELIFVPRQESISAPHFVFYVKQLLEEAYGERLVEQGGLKVTTTLDADLQTIAEDTLTDQTERLAGLGASNAALVAINPQTGDIQAMTGSVDYFNEEIDGNVNVAIRERSPGSSIKPFIYAAAFEKGYTPSTVLIDAETNFGQDYTPKNYDLEEHGPVTMRQALANSLNIPAVKALYLVGVNAATELAQKMGMETLDDPDRYGLSLVLGGGEVRLVDEVSAYGVFAADGVRHPHRAILKVESADQVLFDTSTEELVSEEVLEPEIARLTTNVLSDNNARGLTFGTGSFLQLGARPVAAKTGTTQEFRDGWTMGFTPSLAAGVWVGNNDNSPMRNNAAGANSAAPIWNAFMRAALADKPIEQFVSPAPLTDLPHGVLRNELPEVKTKWEPETNIVYTADCPVAVGQPKTFKEVHNILFYLQRNNPRGASPRTAEADPQFSRWEAGVSAWRDKHNLETKTNPEEIRYTDSLPIPTCSAADSEDLPKVRIIEPNTTILKDSPTTVKVEVDSPQPLKEVRFLFEGEQVASRRPDEPFEVAISFPSNKTGRSAMLVLAITEDNLIGRAHRTFIINPDDSAPSLTLHTPTDGSVLKPESFPLTVKTSASDASGIDYVDVLFHKEGGSGNQRIGQSNTVAPVAPDRYEITWGDSPGPGTYEVFAIAYDKTGNFTESTRHRVTID